MKQSTVLNIQKLDKNRYCYNLIHPVSPDRPFLAPIQQEWEVEVEPETVATLCEMVTEAVNRANCTPDSCGADLEPFVAAGRGLYNALLPTLGDGNVEVLRRALRELKTPLVLSTNDPDIFWEILNDGEGEGFFGLKYEVGRSLKTIRNMRRGVPRRETEWRCLIIADANEDEKDWALESTAAEAAKLRDWLKARNVHCKDFLQGKDATRKAVLEKLVRHTYDIIHYASHVVKDEKTGDYAFRLSGGELFPARAMREHVKGSPIVFLNGCWSGKAVEGLTDAFLQAGAQLVVGSPFELPDEGARVFAENFYESILSGRMVGEAMRNARKQVMGENAYAATWACFVMYGDPCLRIELKEDDLEKELANVGLSRAVLDHSCLTVIEQAFEYGRLTGMVSTAHLFAAMINGEDPHLRKRLQEQRISPESLQQAFEDAFRSSGNVDERSISEIVLTDNVKKILQEGWAGVRSGSREKLTELDLIEAFVRRGGGETGKILLGLGVNVQALSPQEMVEQVGPINLTNSTPGLWQIMISSVDTTKRSGSPVVGTPHLFAGMLGADDGPLSKALRRCGIEPGAVRRLFTPGQPDRLGESKLFGNIPCSPNTSKILLLTQANATADKREKVSEEDLLLAFVRQGGGEIGKWLRQQGVVMEMLVSNVFTNDGELDLSKFDDTAQSILKRLVDCARNKGHEPLGRRHLLYAMLIVEDGMLSRLLDKQGKDAEQLADQLYVAMPAGDAVASNVELKAIQMSTGLLKVICAAESKMKSAQQGTIGEVQLLRAFLMDGGEEAGQFLVARGVRLNRLMV